MLGTHVSDLVVAQAWREDSRAGTTSLPATRLVWSTSPSQTRERLKSRERPGLVPMKSPHTVLGDDSKLLRGSA